MNIEFIEFLHRKGVLFAFAINGGFDQSFRRHQLCWIAVPFAWWPTPQGGDFWGDIHDEWREVCL